MLSALVCVGCSTLCRDYCQQNPVTVYLPPIESCLTEPPPKPMAVPLIGPEGGCPAEFAGCLDVDGGLALESNLRASKRWALNAWIRCAALDGGR